MGCIKKKVYNRKPYDKNLYSWSPNCDDRKNKKKAKGGTPECTAVAGTLGEDWDTTYVYDKLIKKGIEHREAYVECDYVQ